MHPFAALLVGSLAFSSAFAQTAPAPATAMGVAPAAPSALPLTSPEVHPDGTITFRFDAAGAKTVAVTVEGDAQPIPLIRNPAGVWEVTTGVKAPEFYGYTFAVDGSRSLDPHNPTIRPNLINPTSIVHVPAPSPQPWDLTDIPHGEMRHHLYQSKLANDDRDLWVYTPPAYDERRKEAYPVLYLLHGYSDGANGWIDAGQANLILDSLIASGKVKPMVVVMPRAYGTMKMIYGGWNVWSPPFTTALENQRTFTDQLLHEILPMIEGRYNVAKDPAHRALAGLSMGGGHSIASGLNHPEVFSYVGAFSSAIVSPVLPAMRPGQAPPDAATFDKAFTGIVPNAKTQAPFKLFWMSCGTEDSLITSNRAFGAWAKRNIKGDVQTRDTPGMHTWMVWRDDLIAFTPLLFR